MKRHLIFVVFALGLVASTASGQASRTWVSGVGDDVNPCSRTAPCKTFAGAISKTAAGGEINVIDSAGYGAVTITKSITIDGAGVLASVLVGAGQNAIIVNAGLTDTVTLRNLSLNGGTNASRGLNGIRWIAGKSLRVENCHIFGFTNRGITVEVTTGGNLFVLDTDIQDMGGYGVITDPAGINGITTVLNRVSIHNAANGTYFGNGSKVLIRDSNISRNAGVGIQAAQVGQATEVMVENTTIQQNQQGIVAGSGASETRLSNSVVMNNSLNGFNFVGGTVVSFGNNRIRNNGGSNVPTSTVGQQ